MRPSEIMLAQLRDTLRQVLSAQHPNLFWEIYVRPPEDGPVRVRVMALRSKLGPFVFEGEYALGEGQDAVALARQICEEISAATAS